MSLVQLHVYLISRCTFNLLSYTRHTWPFDFIIRFFLPKKRVVAPRFRSLVLSSVKGFTVYKTIPSGASETRQRMKIYVRSYNADKCTHNDTIMQIEYRYYSINRYSMFKDIAWITYLWFHNLPASTDFPETFWPNHKWIVTRCTICTNCNFVVSTMYALDYILYFREITDYYNAFTNRLGIGVRDQWS